MYTGLAEPVGQVGQLPHQFLTDLLKIVIQVFLDLGLKVKSAL